MTTSGPPNRANEADLHASEDASQWLEAHGDVLYRYARARVAHRELAEDLVQETFLAAVQAREPFRKESSVRTWLTAILRRKIVDHYRRAPRTVERELPAEPETPRFDKLFTAEGRWQAMPGAWSSPEGALENREFWTVLRGCLSKLPASLAKTFMLRELVGAEVEEVRTTQALSAANVRVRMHRARLLLRECLERNWFGETLHQRKRSS